MNLLTAPIDSLYRKEFYKAVVGHPLSKGFLYLAYLSAIAAALLFFVLVFRLSPEANKFMDWVEAETPSMTLTPDGLTMNARSPYSMVHPELGPIVTIDTTRDLVSPEEMGDAAIFVTAKRFYVREGEEIQGFDLTRDVANVDPQKYIQQIDGALIKKIYKSMKPFALLMILVFFFFFFYLLKIFEVAIYACIGYFICNIRKAPLSFKQLYQIGCFAITLVTLIQLRGFLLPVLAQIPFGFFGSVIVMSVYYLFIIKSFDPPKETPGSTDTAS